MLSNAISLHHGYPRNTLVSTATFTVLVEKKKQLSGLWEDQTRHAKLF